MNKASPLHKNGCDGKHVWPRGQPGVTMSGWGRRMTVGCNECLALKVTIETHQSDGTTSTVEAIVEPAVHF